MYHFYGNRYTFSFNYLFNIVILFYSLKLGDFTIDRFFHLINLEIALYIGLIKIASVIQRLACLSFQRSRVRLPAMPETFSGNVESGTGSIQHREDNWVATWYVSRETRLSKLKLRLGIMHC